MSTKGYPSAFLYIYYKTSMYMLQG